MRYKSEKFHDKDTEISLDKISANARSFFKDKFYLIHSNEQNLLDLIRCNMARSQISKKNKTYPSVFLENLRSLIDFGNSIKNNKHQKEIIQVLTGVFEVGDYLAINSHQLKNTVGNFSNSTIHKFTSVFCGSDIKGDMRKSILDSTFLITDRNQQLRWSVRPKIKSQLTTLSQDLIEEVISVKNKQLSEKYSRPTRKYRPRKKHSDDESSSSYSEEENPDDIILVKARKPRQIITKEVPRNEEIEIQSKTNESYDQYEKEPLEKSLLSVAFKPEIQELPTFKLSDPIPVDFLFTNTSGSSCFH